MPGKAAQSTYRSIPGTIEGSSHPFHVAVSTVDPATIAPALLPQYTAAFGPVQADIILEVHIPLSIQCWSQKVFPPYSREDIK
mmetsp:Transcript_22952/g.41447  ORF Transcript_22952/g.41447 Transcript_22952/m.41447 type:complete len:83 (+) Transcript_22952:406-654(+)